MVITLNYYPLVMCYKTMGRSTIFNGRIHYFDWAIFNSYVTNYQRVYPRRIVDQSILVYSMLMMQYWQYHCWLVVWSLDHEFYDFPSGWECHHPNWRSHIFHRGRYTTNQLTMNPKIWNLNVTKSPHVSALEGEHRGKYWPTIRPWDAKN